MYSELGTSRNFRRQRMSNNIRIKDKWYIDGWPDWNTAQGMFCGWRSSYKWHPRAADSKSARTFERYLCDWAHMILLLLLISLPSTWTKGQRQHCKPRFGVCECRKVYLLLALLSDCLPSTGNKMFVLERNRLIVTMNVTAFDTWTPAIKI